LGLAIDQVGARRVVLDTIEVLFTALGNEAIVRSELSRLLRWIKDRGLTVVITSERGRNGELTRYGIEEYVSDCVSGASRRSAEAIDTARRICRQTPDLHRPRPHHRGHQCVLARCGHPASNPERPTMNAPAPITGAAPVAIPVQPAPAAPGSAARNATRPLRILLIEDNPADARLTQEHLRGSAITCDVATTLRDVTAPRLAAVDMRTDRPGPARCQRPAGAGPGPHPGPVPADRGAHRVRHEVTGLVALRAGAQDYLVKQRADGNEIARAIRFAVARKHLQLTADSHALHELDLADDLVQQLFAIALAMGTSRCIAAENDPAMAVRIADHRRELQLVIQRLLDTVYGARRAQRAGRRGPDLPE